MTVGGLLIRPGSGDGEGDEQENGKRCRTHAGPYPAAAAISSGIGPTFRFDQQVQIGKLDLNPLE